MILFSLLSLLKPCVNNEISQLTRMIYMHKRLLVRKIDEILLFFSFVPVRPHRKYKQKTYKRKSYDKPCIKEI